VLADIFNFEVVYVSRYIQYCVCLCYQTYSILGLSVLVDIFIIEVVYVSRYIHY